jgi:hypothetical protein
MFIQTIRVVMLASAIAGVAWCVSLHQPQYIPFAEGFHDRMKVEANIGKLRAWMGDLGGLDQSEVPRSEWPAAVVQISPRHVLMTSQEQGTPSLRLVWGGGFGHWGVVVGPEDMPNPQPSEHLFVLPLEPGSYVWHEIQQSRCSWAG